MSSAASDTNEIPDLNAISMFVDLKINGWNFIATNYTSISQHLVAHEFRRCEFIE